MLVDRRADLPPAEAAKCRWINNRVPFKDIGGWVELADGRQVIFAEGVDDVLVAAEWLPCPG